eukprot:TRINITY_DN49722_c0_g1_i1.p1 TRINITY_DN49722_c0_g1~~TRINITY_DN49722_c0_g1_i1.p1  ORF type:complete len:307 (-),score=41.63 TRINITY_DN49722_c0_g1_i1:94-1014(-)
MVFSDDHRTILAKTRRTPNHSEAAGFQNWACRACFGFGLIMTLAVATQILSSKRNRYHSAGIIRKETSSAKNGHDISVTIPVPACVVPSKAPRIGGDALPALQRALGASKGRLLVFDPMADAEYWVASNCNGETLLLQGLGDIGRLSETVRASTKVMAYPKADPLGFVNDEQELRRLTTDGLPRDVLTGTWDAIIVGSSISSSVLNIFSAHRLSGSKTVVFVDSCDKPERKAFVKRWLIQDGVELTRFSNGRGGNVCRFVPFGVLGMDDGWLSTSLATFGVLLCVVAHHSITALMRTAKVKSVGSS